MPLPRLLVFQFNVIVQVTCHLNSVSAAPILADMERDRIYKVLENGNLLSKTFHNTVYLRPRPVWQRMHVPKVKQSAAQRQV